MEHQHPLNPSLVIMYATENCVDCHRVKKFFEANNIPCQRVLLEGNIEATDFVMQINNGRQSVPTIILRSSSNQAGMNSKPESQTHDRGS